MTDAVCAVLHGERLPSVEREPAVGVARDVVENHLARRVLVGLSQIGQAPPEHAQRDGPRHHRNVQHGSRHAEACPGRRHEVKSDAHGSGEAAMLRSARWLRSFGEKR